MGYERFFTELLWLVGRSGKTRKRILEYQEKKLRQLIVHAYKNVAYYRDLMNKAKISPADIRSLSDLGKIPITSKKNLFGRRLQDKLARSIKPGGCLSFKTSGATGEPIEVLRSRSEEFILSILRKRAMDEFGLKPRDLMVRISSLRRKQMSLIWRVAQNFGFYRQKLIHYLDTPQRIASELIRIGPDVVTSNTYVLARALTTPAFQQDGVRKFSPRFVVTGATTLTPSLRRLIQRTLNSVVFDCYETQELGLVAWECPHTGLFHVCDDSVILEILNNGVPAGDGEEGEIFATSLHLKTMPFIRLKVGDLVRKGPDPCPCGVPFSTLESIQGRTEDFLLLPGKREVQASTIFSIIHEHAPWVIQYELEQIHEREVILRIVPHHHGDVCLEELRGRIIKTLGQDVVLKIEVLDEIEPDPERKYKVFKSRLRPYIGFDSSRS